MLMTILTLRRVSGPIWQSLMSVCVVFDMIRHITDPEHPNTLEDLAVLSLEDIHVLG